MNGPKNLHKQSGSTDYLTFGMVKNPCVLTPKLAMSKVAELGLSDNFVPNGPGVRLFVSDYGSSLDHQGFHGTMWKEAQNDMGELELHLIDDVPNVGGFVAPTEEALPAVRDEMADIAGMEPEMQVQPEPAPEPTLDERIEENKEEKEGLLQELMDLRSRVEELQQVLDGAEQYTESMEILAPKPVNMGFGPNMAIQASKKQASSIALRSAADKVFGSIPGVVNVDTEVSEMLPDEGSKGDFEVRVSVIQDEDVPDKYPPSKLKGGKEATASFKTAIEAAGYKVVGVEELPNATKFIIKQASKKQASSIALRSAADGFGPNMAIQASASDSNTLADRLNFIGKKLNKLGGGPGMDGDPAFEVEVEEDRVRLTTALGDALGEAGFVVQVKGNRVRLVEDMGWEDYDVTEQDGWFNAQRLLKSVDTVVDEYIRSVDGKQASKKQASNQDAESVAKNHGYRVYVDRPGVPKWLHLPGTSMFVVINEDGTWEHRDSKYKDRPPLLGGKDPKELDAALTSDETLTVPQPIPEGGAKKQAAFRMDMSLLSAKWASLWKQAEPPPPEGVTTEEWDKELEKGPDKTAAGHGRYPGGMDPPKWLPHSMRDIWRYAVERTLEEAGADPDDPESVAAALGDKPYAKIVPMYKHVLQKYAPDVPVSMPHAYSEQKKPWEKETSPEVTEALEDIKQYKPASLILLASMGLGKRDTLEMFQEVESALKEMMKKWNENKAKIPSGYHLSESLDPEKLAMLAESIARTRLHLVGLFQPKIMPSQGNVP